MATYWSTVNDDELKVVDKTVDFLQNEFCPPDADPMWSVEYFRWKLGSANPAGKGYLSLAMIDDRVVGTVSLTKKRLLINGVECIGGEVGDSYSSAAVRRKSRPVDLSAIDSNPESYINKSIFGRLASDVRARAEADGISLIYGTPNKNAYPGWIDRLGYFDLKEYVNRSHSRPTANIVAREYPALRFVAALLRHLDASVVAVQKYIYSRCQSAGLTIENSTPSPAEIDDLWSRLKPARGFSLVRDAAYWRHRYLEHPLAQYRFYSVRDNDRLAGIVVTRLVTIGAGRRVASIVEWLNEDRASFGYVLSAIMASCKDSAVDVFNLWAEASSAEARAATRSLFSSRHRIPIIFADTPIARSLQTMARDIRFYIGSSDAL